MKHLQVQPKTEYELSKAILALESLPDQMDSIIGFHGSIAIESIDDGENEGGIKGKLARLVARILEWIKTAGAKIKSVMASAVENIKNIVEKVKRLGVDKRTMVTQVLDSYKKGNDMNPKEFLDYLNRRLSPRQRAMFIAFSDKAMVDKFKTVLTVVTDSTAATQKANKIVSSVSSSSSAEAKREAGEQLTAMYEKALENYNFADTIKLDYDDAITITDEHVKKFDHAAFNAINASFIGSVTKVFVDNTKAVDEYLSISEKLFKSLQISATDDPESVKGNIGYATGVNMYSDVLQNTCKNNVAAVTSFYTAFVAVGHAIVSN